MRAIQKNKTRVVYGGRSIPDRYQKRSPRITAYPPQSRPSRQEVTPGAVGKLEKGVVRAARHGAAAPVEASVSDAGTAIEDSTVSPRAMGLSAGYLFTAPPGRGRGPRSLARGFSQAHTGA